MDTIEQIEIFKKELNYCTKYDYYDKQLKNYIYILYLKQKIIGHGFVQPVIVIMFILERKLVCLENNKLK